MSNRSGSGWNNKPIVTILGIIASIITICVFFTGIQSIQDVIKLALPRISFPINFPTAAPPNTQIPSNSDTWPGHIVFIYNNQISEITAGGEISPLFVAPKNATNLRWSPDGRHIAYIAYDINDTPAVFVMDSDGTNGREFLPPPHQYGFLDDVAWFTDSNRLLFVAQYYGFGIIDIGNGKIDTLGTCQDSNSWIDVWPRAIALNGSNDNIGFYDFSSGQIMVRPIQSSQCSIWLSKSDMSTYDITPVSFSKDGKQIIFYSSGNLYWLNAPDTAAARTILIGKITDVIDVHQSWLRLRPA
jgi:WD40 repeat protein